MSLKTPHNRISKLASCMAAQAFEDGIKVPTGGHVALSTGVLIPSYAPPNTCTTSHSTTCYVSQYVLLSVGAEEV
eukprot:1159281-Pelagomonas_calceolata.AAC.3